MGAGMLGEIDQLRSFSDATQSRFGYGFGLSGERDDAAVVVGIALAIEQINTRNFTHGRNDGIHFGDVATFREIGNALDESFHGIVNCWNE
jgi:hypothetical protein